MDQRDDPVMGAEPCFFSLARLAVPHGGQQNACLISSSITY